MELDPSTFANMSPEEFARTITAMSDPEVVELMLGEQRLPVLEAIFDRFPGLFRPDRARGVVTTTQFRITGGPDERPHDTYEILIDDGGCRISLRPGDDYDVSLMMAPPEFMRMVTGRAKPTVLVMRGKMSVKGDIAAAAAFPLMFDIPKA